jgi:hypothetical protein
MSEQEAPAAETQQPEAAPVSAAPTNVHQMSREEVVTQARGALQQAVANKNVTPSVQQAHVMSADQINLAVANALTNAANLHIAAAACLIGNGKEAMQGLFASQGQARA